MFLDDKLPNASPTGVIVAVAALRPVGTRLAVNTTAQAFMPTWASKGL